MRERSAGKKVVTAVIAALVLLGAFVWWWGARDGDDSDRFDNGQTIGIDDGRSEARRRPGSSTADEDETPHENATTPPSDDDAVPSPPGQPPMFVRARFIPRGLPGGAWSGPGVSVAIGPDGTAKALIPEPGSWTMRFELFRQSPWQSWSSSTWPTPVERVEFEIRTDDRDRQITDRVDPDQFEAALAAAK